jgi:hypothetical protein
MEWEEKKRVAALVGRRERGREGMIKRDIKMKRGKERKDEREESLIERESKR